VLVHSPYLVDSEVKALIFLFSTPFVIGEFFLSLVMCNPFSSVICASPILILAFLGSRNCDVSRPNSLRFYLFLRRNFFLALFYPPFFLEICLLDFRLTLRHCKFFPPRSVSHEVRLAFSETHASPYPNCADTVV